MALFPCVAFAKRFRFRSLFARAIALLVLFVLIAQGFIVGPVTRVGASTRKPVVDTSSPPQPFIVTETSSIAQTLATTLFMVAGIAKPAPGKDEAAATMSAKPLPTLFASASPAELAAMRLNPKEATGGTDLYSRNFGWGTSLVSLPGRSGLDLNLGISYNSLVWLKDSPNSTMYFDPDLDNVSPGFRLGLPEVEAKYTSTVTSLNSYLMVTPEGRRVEFRDSGSGIDFVTADSSYTTLNEVWPRRGIAPNKLIVTSTDGTQMTYEWEVSAWKCTSVQDRNGNYISLTYNVTSGKLETMTDTLGRVVTVNYTSDYPTSITQTWKDTNGSGSNVTHTWATLDYTNVTVSTSFSGLSVNGPANSTTVKALEKITYADGSFTKFEYNGYVQVKKISNLAADTTWLIPHVLNYLSTDLDSVSGSQTDCPRFGTTRSWVENFNLDGSGVPQEVVTTNTAPSSTTFSGPYATENASVVKVAMTGDPDHHYTRIFFGPASDYREGLPLRTEDCTDTGSSCSTRVRWTWNSWTQDNTGVGYITNPRTTETRVGDGTNTKRTTIGYGSNGFGLPEEVKVYDADLSTVLKTQTTSYSSDTAYLTRRIIGLPTETKLYEGTTSGTLMSKVTYAYDYDDDFAVSGMGQNNTGATQHDDTNYGATFSLGRGNLTSVTRWDATAPTTSGSAVTSTILYNITGGVVAKTDPLSHTVKIGYTDSFNSTLGVSTYAYPTTVTDPNSKDTTIKYRYDFGATVEATPPPRSGSTAERKTVSTYSDDTGRITRNATWLYASSAWSEHNYSRYEYPTNGIQTQSYAPIVDADGDGNIAEDEVYTESWLDGAGRVRRSRTEHPGSTGGWAATQTEYDILGRVYRTSVPTEVSVSGTTWTPAGDDSTRGWLWNIHKYDWKGRPIRDIKTDGIDSSTLNDSDVLYSYDGCGCAGGQVTTIQGENVIETDYQGNNANTLGRRKQKIYEDILGRPVKTEVFEWNGSTVYTTTVNTYNGRDQVTQSRKYAGTTSATTYQDTTMSYDGHGRLYQSHRPEQRIQPNTLKYTTYSYNADDSIQSVTDGRGAVTGYTYNSRGLATNIAYTVPSGSGIEDPSDIGFSYDNLGNRTQMTDGLGQVDYEYDSLSKLTAETRDFTDTLDDAPISGGKFKLEYTYNLTGGLKSLKDPYGQQFNYSQDKVGRLSSVIGSTSFDGITTYTSSPTYNARGILTGLSYGNGVSMSATSFNSRLQATNFEVKKGTTSLVKKQYQFLSDGSLKYSKDELDSKWDRMYKYDNVGRTEYGLSGAEARGSLGDYTSVPYRRQYQYNKFDQIEQFYGYYYDTVDTVAYGYWNNRQQYPATADDDGNILDDGDTVYQHDAAGHLFSTAFRDPETSTLSTATIDSFDGLGQLTKRDHSGVTNYYIRSTVLNTVISDTLLTGAKLNTYIPANGAVLATQTAHTVGGTAMERVAFIHQDPRGSSIQTTEANGDLTQPGGRTGEYDPMGRNVTNRFDYMTLNTLPPEGGGDMFGSSSGYRPGKYEFTSDGMPVPYSVVQQKIESGRIEGVFGLARLQMYFNSWRDVRDISSTDRQWLRDTGESIGSMISMAINRQGPSKECLSALDAVKADEGAYRRALNHRADLEKAVQDHQDVSENFRDSFGWQMLAAIGIRESGFDDRDEVGGGGGQGVFQITGTNVSAEVRQSVEKSADWVLTNKLANVYMEPVVQGQPLSVLWTLRNYNAGGKSSHGRKMSLEILKTGSVNAADWDRGTGYPGLNLKKAPIDLNKGNYVSSVLRIARDCFGDPKTSINF